MDGLSNKSRSRRSLPALGDLHITPLTHAPLESPIIDDDDVDASTASPHHTRRRSYISSRSLPQTPSILSRSPSRTRQHRGHRSAKSALTLTSLDGASLFGPDASGVRPNSAGRNARPKSAIASGRQTPARVRIADVESTDFLLRTASMLVENSSESKGQGWISKRNSSTSLASYDVHSPKEERERAYGADDEFSATWSRRGSANASRRESRRNSVSLPGSRWGSRRGSRAVMAGAGWRTPGAGPPKDGYFEEMGLDIADEEGWVSEEEEEDTIDESELKRLLRRRVGGFFEDVFGGWFDLRGEDEAESDNDEDEVSTKNLDNNNQTAKERKQRFAGIRKGDIIEVQPASEKAGTFTDARWFLGLARSILI